MAQLLFYEEIIPLDRERHRDLRIERPRDDAAFAAATHYAPVAGSEFEFAARDYPILFTASDAGEEGQAKEDGSSASGPVLLFGLTAGVNPFVTGEGRWRSGTYMPAFVRRYPFVLARKGEEDYSVCIDRAYGGLGADSGERLFDEDGGDSETLKGHVAFLQRYLADIEQTRAFQQRLEELDLLVTQDLKVTRPDGREYSLRQFRFVDPARLARLEDAQIVQLQRDGHLAWIHAHRISLANLVHLEAREVVERTPGERSAGESANAELAG